MKLKNQNGSITFKNDNTNLQNLQLLNSPICIARLQKTIIEAVITDKLDINKNEWHVIIKENDVPCAALAFEDLKQMFNNLTELTTDYEHMKFPKVNLEIIGSEDYLDSVLHLDYKPNAHATKQQKNKIYDLVIDISMSEYDIMNESSFSEFACKNQCYFNIRSSKNKRRYRQIYTTDTINYKPLIKKDSNGNFQEIESNKNTLKYFIQLLFRKENFRQGQLPILSRALQNQCVIGLLPTGGGKSLTYQLAAMLQPGVTIIIDPLRSLMKDQYDGLIKIGIDSCAFINSTISSTEKAKCENQLITSQLQFVFLSPERLCIYKFRELLNTMREMNVYFAYGVIDEVHCVSEWGHDFRFSYLHLARNLYNYVHPKKANRLTLFGLTATASFDVLADVERELSGNGAFTLDSDAIVRYENTNRLELQYKIEKVPIEFEPDKYFDTKEILDPSLGKAVNIANKWAVFESKKEFLNKYISKIPFLVNKLQEDNSINRIKKLFNERQNTDEDIKKINLKVEFPIDYYKKQKIYEQAGIVFCPHKNKTGISINENANSLNKIVSKVGTFMGSGNDEDANEIDRVSFENLDLFRENKLPLMIATKAFGMGIDKPNVRFTINMNYSSSLESFIQEAGRAGRDKKIALATILFADYKLVRINPQYQETKFPISLIKNKWFKENDLNKILKYYDFSIPNKYFDYFTPNQDLVKLRCDKDEKKFRLGQCNECSQFKNCNLSKTPSNGKGFQYFKDLENIFKSLNIDFPKKNLHYISADYDTVMFFYNKNFKGSLVEKRIMHKILSNSEIKFFTGDDEEKKIDNFKTAGNFLKKLLSLNTGTKLVTFISYERNEYADIAKAIYRMCCIELIDDFTQDYNANEFRIVTIRKADGEYYNGLKRFLTRYYSNQRAEEEIKKVLDYKGDNEIHKCLGYLTEFIYEKIAVKRKRSIDDMRTFCLQGIDPTRDWQDINEDLKDFIYYYFNSKYAQDDYETESGESFSLTTDTDKGKLSSFEILFKYLRVINEDVYGSSGSPKDNVKHLQGAVRLIRRSLTDINPALSMLNAFCIAYLDINKDIILKRELEESFKEGYKDFYNSTDKNIFYEQIKKLISELESSDIPKKTIKKFEAWTSECELDIHTNWLKTFIKNYIKE